MRALVLVALAACSADPTVFHDPSDPDAGALGDADERELVGFTGPFDGAPLSVTALDGFHGGPMPRCWIVDQVALVVAAAPDGAMVQLGLYEHDDDTPRNRVWQSGPVALAAGAGMRVLDVADAEVHTDRPQSSWIAVMTMAGVTLASQATTGRYCSKPHTMGQPFPHRFDDDPDPSCSTAAPPAIWLVGRAASGC